MRTRRCETRSASRSTSRTTARARDRRRRHERRRDLHVEIVDYRGGTGWVAERLRDLLSKHRVNTIVCDKYSVLPGLDDLSVRSLTVRSTRKRAARSSTPSSRRTSGISAAPR